MLCACVQLRVLGKGVMVSAGARERSRLDHLINEPLSQFSKHHHQENTMRHAGSFQARPTPLGGNKNVPATEPRIRERKEVCERAHTTCPPEHCRSMHASLSFGAWLSVLTLLPFAWLLHSRSCPQDRQAREKVEDWMDRGARSRARVSPSPSSSSSTGNDRPSSSAASTPGSDKQQHAHYQAPAIRLPVPTSPVFLTGRAVPSTGNLGRPRRQQQTHGFSSSYASAT
jgi:hypothetical protein